MAIEITSVEDGRRRRKVLRAKDAKKSLKGRTRSRKRRIILSSTLTSFLLIFIAGTVFFIYSYNYYVRIVDARLKSGFLTSRAGIYAAPRTLRRGQALTPDALVEHLRRAGYVESNASDAWSGSFTVAGDDAVEIHPRRSSTTAPATVRVEFKKDRIAEITGDLGVTLDSYALEPEILTTDAMMKTGKRTPLSFNDIPPV